MHSRKNDNRNVSYSNSESIFCPLLDDHDYQDQDIRSIDRTNPYSRMTMFPDVFSHNNVTPQHNTSNEVCSETNNKYILNNLTDAQQHNNIVLNDDETPGTYPGTFVKVASALFYAFASFLITNTNKLVLTTYQFPSFILLGLGQLIVTVLVLGLLNIFKFVEIRSSVQNHKVWVLSFSYLVNLVSGLGATKHLSIPMFTVLRRFSLVMIAISEYFVLGTKQSKSIIVTICFMILGSIIAAMSDISFNLLGYFLATTNNVFTTVNMIYIKLSINSQEISKLELLYYNAVLTILPLGILAYFTNSFEAFSTYNQWTSVGFVICFISSCIMGFVLMYSTLLCTQYNSPLTTSIIGTLKNITNTYIGMFIGGDYIFGWLNFIGLNIAMVASLAYTYIVFSQKSKPRINSSQSNHVTNHDFSIKSSV